jgi:hypothetical protein
LTGKRVAVARRLTHAGTEHFAIEGSNGCPLQLPAWRTESWAANLQSMEAPILPFAGLSALSELLRS